LRFVLFSPPAFEPEIDQTKPGEESSEILSFNGLLQANFVHLTLDVVSWCWVFGKGIEVWGENDRNVGKVGRVLTRISSIDQDVLAR
jgi:hypothetical protein